MGGEKARLWYTDSAKRGSPPHGRGKVQLDDPEGGDLRITPAWAGKSKRTRSLFLRPEDHPRMGGEKMMVPHTLTRARGSPPHGRGKAVHFRC